jgi:predicted nucleic acid-binding protein
MKILFDTNIILDVLLNRINFVDLSATLISLVESKDIEGYLCSTTITTIDYLITKALNRDKAKNEIKKLLNMFQISSVNSEVINLSVISNFKDFEDAVQYYSGKCNGVDAIVTRNIKDFQNTELPVYTPDELLGIIRVVYLNK